MIRIAIVEDEKKAADLLSAYLTSYSEENCVQFEIEVFGSGESFISAYKYDYEIILMDIEMPGIDGLETARRLRAIDNDAVLLFVTNMAQYALKGYEVDAVDYAVKPVSYPDFAMKIKKALRFVNKKTDRELTVFSVDGLTKIKVSDIYYVEVILHYLIYHTSEGNIKVRGSLKESERELIKYGFARCNSCYLVNMQHIKAVRGFMLAVAGDEIAISRSKKTDFMKSYAKYIGGLK